MEKDELTPVERALIILAEHIEYCPYNEYKVMQEVTEALGLERVPEEL